MCSVLSVEVTVGHLEAMYGDNQCERGGNNVLGEGKIMYKGLTVGKDTMKERK